MAILLPCWIGLDSTQSRATSVTVVGCRSASWCIGVGLRVSVVPVVAAAVPTDRVPGVDHRAALRAAHTGELVVVADGDLPLPADVGDVDGLEVALELLTCLHGRQVRGVLAHRADVRGGEDGLGGDRDGDHLLA